MTDARPLTENGVRLTEAEWHEIRVECAPPTDYGILRGLIESILTERLAQAWDEGYACGLGDYGKGDDETVAMNPHRVLPPGKESRS